MDQLLNRLTGIADEGDSALKGQIELHKRLKFNSIELRSIEKVNITKLSDKAFDKVYAQLDENNMGCAGFGSEIANWARKISHPFEEDLNDLKRSISRMKKLDTNLIRIMSYPNDNYSKEDWRKEVIRRISELTKIAEDNNIILGMEICDGWASDSPENLEELLSEVDSPSLKVILDPGNPIGHKKSIEESWRFYYVALEKIVHFHIKDCKIVNGETVHTYPGMGDCDLKLMIRDILSHGYKGLFSIEPHLHFDYNNGMYYKYGNMLKDMISDIVKK
ncbi:MAG: sugar phosphate isomerase/epimerase family protein [Pleomorphochaeta sp.]